MAETTSCRKLERLAECTPAIVRCMPCWSWKLRHFLQKTNTRCRSRRSNRLPRIHSCRRIRRYCRRHWTLVFWAAHGTARVGYFSSGWPVAYLIATVISGIALVVGALVPISQPVQVARQSSPPSRLDAEPKMEPVVGRITGMVDCKWAGAALDSPGVPLGRKFELASGLMEITYDSGAKVILQGPVTYEVESASGGYLAVGKLTGKVEVAAARGFSCPQSHCQRD